MPIHSEDKLFIEAIRNLNSEAIRLQSDEHGPFNSADGHLSSSPAENLMTDGKDAGSMAVTAVLFPHHPCVPGNSFPQQKVAPAEFAASTSSSKMDMATNAASEAAATLGQHKDASLLQISSWMQAIRSSCAGTDISSSNLSMRDRDDISVESMRKRKVDDIL
jgi:hypothetical protein